MLLCVKEEIENRAKKGQKGKKRALNKVLYKIVFFLFELNKIKWSGKLVLFKGFFLTLLTLLTLLKIAKIAKSWRPNPYLLAFFGEKYEIRNVIFRRA